jgi:hypothetical protein
MSLRSSVSAVSFWMASTTGGGSSKMPCQCEMKPFALARAVAELVLPAGFANVHAAQIFRVLVKEQRVQRLLVGKRAGRTPRRPCARDWMFHSFMGGNLTTKTADEHEEISPRISHQGAAFSIPFCARRALKPSRRIPANARWKFCPPENLT